MPGVFPDIPSHGVTEESDQFARFRTALFRLEPSVHVLGVLTEHDHVHSFRVHHRGGHARIPAHGPQADVQVELLPQGDIQAADAAAHGRGEGPLDADEVGSKGFLRLRREPVPGFPEGLLPREHGNPFHASTPAVRARNRFVEHAPGGAPDVGPCAVSFDVRDQGIVRD